MVLEVLLGRRGVPTGRHCSREEGNLEGRFQPRRKSHHDRNRHRNTQVGPGGHRLAAGELGWCCQQVEAGV